MNNPLRHGQSDGSYHGMREDQNQPLGSQVHGSQSINIAGLSRPLPHKSRRDYQQLIRNQTLTSCFPIGDRMRLGLKKAFCCLESNESFVDILKVSQKQFTPEVSRDYVQNVLSHRIVKLTIQQTSRLELDYQVIHPFVKIHFVNKDNGCYLQKNKDIQSVTYHFENGGYVKNGVWKSTYNDIILPLSTTCVDFRVQGSSRGIWNQKFYINQLAETILKPDTIILFELLDFNHQGLIQRNIKNLSQDNFYRVGWAYLRPIGLGKKHLGRNKLQLYQYKLNAQKLPSDFKQSCVPAVYYEFIWPLHQKYQGYLQVDLSLCNRPDFQYANQAVNPQHIFQRQHQDQGLLKKYQQIVIEQKKQTSVSKFKNLLNFYRIKQCKIPDSFVQKFPSAESGCLRIAMTDDTLLACCSFQNKTIIKGFSLQTLKHIFTLRGHKGIIYSISISYDQKYFLTVGSDYLAKLWVIPKHTGDFVDQKNSQNYLLAEAVHPSFVYSSCIFQYIKQNQLIFVTGCYDGYIRIWRTNTEGNSQPLCEQIKISNSFKVYPLSITQGQGFFIVGDSIGGIHIYDVQLGATLDNICKKRVQFNHSSLKDDPIYTIHILDKANIIVQCKDNIIRHFQISTGNPKVVRSYVGSQSQNYLIKSTISPDRRFLLSGSQDGRPVMWQTDTGQLIPTDHLQLDIEGPIIDCCWNKKFNLVAFSGFVQQCPVFLYGHKVKQTDPQIILALMQKRQ